MRIGSALALGLLLGVAAPMSASAKLLSWSGTLTIEAGGLIGFQLLGVGSGSSLVNASGGGNHLSTISIANGISVSDLPLPSNVFGVLLRSALPASTTSCQHPVTEIRRCGRSWMGGGTPSRG